MGTSVARHPLAMKTFLILIVAAAAPPALIQPAKADINDDMLQQHNDYRAAHNAGPLTIDQDLMEKAQAWADELAANNKFEHTSVKNLNGECLGEKLVPRTPLECGTARWTTTTVQSISGKIVQLLDTSPRWSGKTPRGLALALPQAAMA